MGKRKSSGPKPGGGKKKELLSTTFQCLFCNHENSVLVQLDKKTGQGHLRCKVCAQTFSCQINYLSAAVDVYSDWIDACDAVKKGGEAENVRPGRATAPLRSGAGGGAAAIPEEDDDDLDGFVENDEPEGYDD